MADVVSRSSIESASDDFVVVDAEPKLKIGGNGDPHDLEKKLKEVLVDDQIESSQPQAKMLDEEKGEKQATDTLTVGKK